MTQELTEDQAKAVKLARRLAETPGSVGIIKGYAGTGKTFTLKTILQELGVYVLAPTGKAASRVQELTGYQASTIHRWLYEPQEDPNTGVVTFGLKPLEKIPRPTSGLIVVDEASMVSSDIWADLRETCQQLKLSIIMMGDGFQLPPVSLNAENPFSVFDDGFCNSENVVELKKIHRQALDSPIIRASMYLREGDIMDAMVELDTIEDDELDPRINEGLDDMFIVWKNSTRHVMNSHVRQLRGLPKDDINAGEPMLVLRNNYKLEVYNGEVYEFRGWSEKLGAREFKAKLSGEKETKYLSMNFGATPVSAGTGIVAMEVLRGHHDNLSPFWPEKAVDWWQRNGRGTYLHVNWGYTLTCHKAQGSEADNVLVGLEPGQNVMSMEGRKWLYVAITRAKQKVKIAHLPRNLVFTKPR